MATAAAISTEISVGKYASKVEGYTSEGSGRTPCSLFAAQKTTRSDWLHKKAQANKSTVRDKLIKALGSTNLQHQKDARAIIKYLELKQAGKEISQDINKAFDQAVGNTVIQSTANTENVDNQTVFSSDKIGISEAEALSLLTHRTWLFGFGITRTMQELISVVAAYNGSVIVNAILATEKSAKKQHSAINAGLEVCTYLQRIQYSKTIINIDFIKNQLDRINNNNHLLSIEDITTFYETCTDDKPLLALRDILQILLKQNQESLETIQLEAIAATPVPHTAKDSQDNDCEVNPYELSGLIYSELTRMKYREKINENIKTIINSKQASLAHVSAAQCKQLPFVKAIADIGTVQNNTFAYIDYKPGKNRCIIRELMTLATTLDARSFALAVLSNEDFKQLCTIPASSFSDQGLFAPLVVYKLILMAADQVRIKSTSKADTEYAELKKQTTTAIRKIPLDQNNNSDIATAIQSRIAKDIAQYEQAGEDKKDNSDPTFIRENVDTEDETIAQNAVSINYQRKDEQFSLSEANQRRVALRVFSSCNEKEDDYHHCASQQIIRLALASDSVEQFHQQLQEIAQYRERDEHIPETITMIVGDIKPKESNSSNSNLSISEVNKRINGRQTTITRSFHTKIVALGIGTTSSGGTTNSFTIASGQSIPIELPVVAAVYDMVQVYRIHATVYDDSAKTEASTAESETKQVESSTKDDLDQSYTDHTTKVTQYEHAAFTNAFYKELHSKIRIKQSKKDKNQLAELTTQDIATIIQKNNKENKLIENNLKQVLAPRHLDQSSFIGRCSSIKFFTHEDCSREQREIVALAINADSVEDFSSVVSNNVALASLCGSSDTYVLYNFILMVASKVKIKSISKSDKKYDNYLNNRTIEANSAIQVDSKALLRKINKDIAKYKAAEEDLQDINSADDSKIKPPIDYTNRHEAGSWSSADKRRLAYRVFQRIETIADKELLQNLLQNIINAALTKNVNDFCYYIHYSQHTKANNKLQQLFQITVPPLSEDQTVETQCSKQANSLVVLAVQEMLRFYHANDTAYIAA